MPEMPFQAAGYLNINMRFSIFMLTFLKNPDNYIQIYSEYMFNQDGDKSCYDG